MVRNHTGLGLSILSILFLSHRAESHPAHAKPVNYPYVVGFERFHSSLDDDDYLAGGGMILLNELNCVACHEPPRALKSQFAGVEATNLKGVSTRLGHLDLEIMVRNPRFVKRDTVMPSFFAGPDRDLAEVEALKQYLSTLTYEVPDYPRGDIDAGRKMYHRIGCAACHAPEVGYRPPGIPENAEIELAGLPSVPMNLADLYDLNSITHFLLSPNEHRPSGRMPDFRLSVEEAANLAAYLKAGPDLVLPENLSRALTGDTPFALDATLAEHGKQLFREKNCTACHTIPGAKNSRTLHRATALAKLPVESTGGCLSERPTGGGIPHYGLDEVQKRAIRAALQRLDSRGRLDLAGEVDWRMKRLNCYACHERGGVGGAEFAREVYFGFEDRKAIELGRWGNLPPPLDHVGAKLTTDWMRKVIHGEQGGGRVRTYQSARMPVYARDEAKALPGAFKKQDALAKGAPPKPNLKSLPDGKVLFGAGEKNCIQCHEPAHGKETELPGIDLSHAPVRLQFPWFRELLSHPQKTLPGVPMPELFSNPDGEEEIRAIWKYLESLRQP